MHIQLPSQNTMDRFRTLRNRIASLFSARKLDADLEEELRSHIDLATEENLNRGLSPSEARTAALRRFGGVTQIQETYRKQRGLPAFEVVNRDLRFGLRQLYKSPGFAITAVLTLALGVGANTAIFTLIDSIVLRPLPFPHQDRLVTVTTGGFFPKGWIRALQQNSTSFTSLSGYGRNTESNVTGTNSAERVFGSSVTTNTFDTLGIHPALGSFFTSDNAIQGEDNVVVLSYGYWRDRFAGSSDAIGRIIRIDGVSRRILGVMPPGVQFPDADTRFVIPVAFKGGDPIDPWFNFDLEGIGRLKDGVSPASAQAEQRRLHNQLLPLFPWRMPDIWDSNPSVTSLLDAVVGDTRPKLVLLFAAVSLVLLIACANVANLMLAKAASREREMAIRSALGAARKRIVSQLLIESLLIGALAGITGLGVAYASLRGLTLILPSDTPRLGDIGLHWHVFLFAGIASVLTSILFGLVPALKMSSPDLQNTLRSGSLSVIGKGAKFRVSMALVIGQIALSVVVITTAGLLLRSLYGLSHVNPGFTTARVVTAEVALDASACQQHGHCQAFFQQLVRQLRGDAGIEDAAVVSTLPMTGNNFNYIYDAEGYPRDPIQGAKLATGRNISANYFSFMGLRLLQGRLLTDSDETGTSRAVVISQHMAQSLWPNHNPIGKHILSVGDETGPGIFNPEKASIIVGVVSNTHHDALQSTFGDEVYLPVLQKTETSVMNILIRSELPASQLTPILRNTVPSVDPSALVTHVRSLDQIVASSVSSTRALTVLLLGFGALALGVGVIGVYSLIAYIVNWRTREIGIRLALGASRWEILTHILKQSMALSIMGSFAGLVVAMAAARLLKSFLFEINPIDPLTFCAVPILMLLLAIIAAWIPARRAASVDPMNALRAD